MSAANSPSKKTPQDPKRKVDEHDDIHNHVESNKKAKADSNNDHGFAIDHMSIPCSDTHKSKDWYLTALSALGLKEIMAIPWDSHTIYGLGVTHPILWISPKESTYDGKAAGHVCFRASTREQVDTFYDNAIKAGGKDNGKPGVRAEYSPNYYAAFVRDLDGKNVEVVCHGPPVVKEKDEYSAIVWSDIACHDLERAIKFYSSVLDCKINTIGQGPDSFALLPYTPGRVSGCLVRAGKEHSKVGKSGALIYLNVDGRLKDATDCVAKEGGKVIKPMISLGPHGAYSIILDCEGNYVALHTQAEGSAKADQPDNMIVWGDVPATDLKRAASFYGKVLKDTMHIIGSGADAFTVLRHNGRYSAGGRIIQASEHVKPGKEGPLMYFNVDGRLDEATKIAEAEGGKVLQNRFTMGPHGFRSIIVDSEGNRVALHSNS